MRGRRLRPHDPQGPVADRRRRWRCWRASACRARPSPAPAQRVLDLWRGTLGDARRRGAGRDGRSAGRPGRLRPRRAQAAGRARPGRGRGRRRTGRQSEDGEDGGEQSGAQDNSQEGEGQSQVRTGSPCSARSPSRWRARPPTTTASDVPRTRPPSAEGDDRPGGPQPRRERAEPGQRGGYRAYTRAVRRGDRRRGSVRPRRADPAAPAARSAVAAPAGRDLQARQPAAAPPAGAADPRLGVRSRGGHARRRAGCRGWWSTRCRRCPTSASWTRNSATPW